MKWDPHRENSLFFNQSSSIHVVYYYVQMQVHRPFLRKDSPLAFTSLAICTNAARSCSHVLGTQFRRSALPFPHIIIECIFPKKKPILIIYIISQVSAFTSGIILLLNIWGGRKAGLSTDPTGDFTDIQTCLYVLKILEPT